MGRLCIGEQPILLSARQWSRILADVLRGMPLSARMRDKLPACEGLGAVMQKLFLFLLVLLVIWYVRRALAGAQEIRERASRHSEPEKAAAQSEMMRECRQCGVLVPESEGVVVDGQFYCSTEHTPGHAGRADA